MIITTSLISWVKTLSIAEDMILTKGIPSRDGKKDKPITLSVGFGVKISSLTLLRNQGIFIPC